MIAEVLREAVECLSGAEKCIIGCALCDLFASDRVLLVGKRESGGLYGRHVYVIQRPVGGVVDASICSDGDVLETEGLRAIRVGGESVLRGAEEPEEGGDGEVDDVPVGASFLGVINIEHVEHSTDDRDVGRVGSLGRVILFAEAGEKRSE